jgi:integrase/recombinase XerD
MKKGDLLREYHDWLLLELRMAENSISTYGGEASMFLLWAAAGGYELSLMGSDDINTYIEARQGVDGSEEALSSRTISRIMSSLRSFFDYLVTTEIRKNNPLDKLKPPRMIHTLPQVMTIEDVDRFPSLLKRTLPSESETELSLR